MKSDELDKVITEEDYKKLRPPKVLYSPSNKDYSLKDTILINFDMKCPEFEELKKVCKELKMQIIRMRFSKDILFYNYLVLVLDPEYVKQEDLEALESSRDILAMMQASILFTRKQPFSLSPSKKKFTIKQPALFNYDNLKLIFLNKRASFDRKAKNHDSYDKRMYRMLYIILHLHDKRKPLTTHELCNVFTVTEKTIHRDIALLRMLGNSIIFDKKTNQWSLEYSVDLDEIIKNMFTTYKSDGEKS